jgi:O-antigen ligase
VACVVAILTMGQYLWAAFNSHNLSRMQGYGILYNSLVAAQAFGSLAVASLVLAVTVNRKKPAFFYGGLFIGFAVAVALTQSRGPIISLFAVSLLILLLSPYSVRYRLKVVFLIGVLVVLMLALNPEMMDVLQRKENPFSYRFQIWDYILEHAQQHIIFGQGITRETEFPIENVVFEHSHNVIIDTLRFSGIVGVAVLFWNIKTAFKRWTANKEHYPYYAWLLFGLLCMLTNGKFLLARPDWIWISYWLPLGFICAAQNSSAKHEKS